MQILNLSSCPSFWQDLRVILNLRLNSSAHVSLWQDPKVILSLSPCLRINLWPSPCPSPRWGLQMTLSPSLNQCQGPQVTLTPSFSPHPSPCSWPRGHHRCLPVRQRAPQRLLEQHKEPQSQGTHPIHIPSIFTLVVDLSLVIPVIEFCLALCVTVCQITLPVFGLRYWIVFLYPCLGSFIKHYIYTFSKRITVHVFAYISHIREIGHNDQRYREKCFSCLHLS